MKCVSIKLLKKERKEKQAIRERDAILECAKCPHVINLDATFMDGAMQTLNYVIEYVPNGDLQVVLRHTQSCLSPAATDHILYQLCQAVQFMHSKKIIHRDLKPENVLLTYENIVKLCDFGTSINILKEKPTTFLGSAYYVSPEMMTTKKADEETDYWSLGVILFEMVIGCKMFPGRSEYYVMQRIEKMDHVELPETVPHAETIKGLVNHEKSNRTVAYEKLMEKMDAYSLQETGFRFQAYSPFGELSTPHEYVDFSPISNYDAILTDETNEVESRLLESDECNDIGTVSKRELIVPSDDSMYYGEKIDAFFSGIQVFNEMTWKVLAKQQKYNKWSGFLGKDHLILIQGELFVRDGYHRKVIRRGEDPPAEAQMFLVVVDLKDPENTKELLGIIDGKVRFRVDLCKNFAYPDVPVRCEQLSDTYFTVLKQYPDRSWVFETEEENADDWRDVISQTVPSGLLDHRQ